MKPLNQEVDWKRKKTKSGFMARTVISVLNKEARRGKVMNCLRAATELFISGPIYEAKLWQRLITIAAEDVGLGNPQTYLYVCQQYQRRLALNNKVKIQLLITSCVVKICESLKDRSADEIFNFALAKVILNNKLKTNHILYGSPITILAKKTVDIEKRLNAALAKNATERAVLLSVELCYSGLKAEDLMWQCLKKTAKNKGMTGWRRYIAIAKKHSQLMKFGKNDRYIAAIVVIVGLTQNFELKLTKNKVATNIKRNITGAMIIPKYALDMHSNVRDNFRAKEEDFRYFWNETSKIGPYSAHVLSLKYKNWILKNLDKFVELRIMIKKMVFLEKPVILTRVAGVLLKDGQLLLERSKARPFYTLPGGVVESGEKLTECLIRELKEELGIVVIEGDLTFIGEYRTKINYIRGRSIKMSVFLVKRWIGEILPKNEVEDFLWINKKADKDIAYGDVVRRNIIPLLKRENLMGS